MINLSFDTFEHKSLSKIFGSDIYFKIPKVKWNNSICLPLYRYQIFLNIFSTSKESITGKSVSEALILESVKPQYDDILFIDSQLQYKKNTSSEHLVYKNCFECQNKTKKQYLYTTMG